jgi:hypothetical protein
MGNTCASIHIAWRGAVEDAARAISRGYGRLGYERVKKAPAEGDKHVVMLARPARNYVSVYDSDSANLDNGELIAAGLKIRAGWWWRQCGKLT